MMQDGKALQAGTSHNLGQNFAKAFDVKFQDKNGELKYVYATSWGVSTRLIGALIMTHGDDNGLIIPPKLAQTQMVMIPIWKEATRGKVLQFAENVYRQLKTRFAVKLDAREQYKPGYKYAEWEMAGVPLRIEVGPRDVENNQVMLVRRDTRKKIPTPLNSLENTIEKLLEKIQRDLFERALKLRQENTHQVETYDEFKKVLEEKGGFIEAHWSGDPENLRISYVPTIKFWHDDTGSEKPPAG
ncbi:proline--tRNA ligase [candidate division KSB1 bacterium 4484_188]|nr:MAG: proline--tRNA ligase [candidate division KSB1 bacterium 4484_188]